MARDADDEPEGDVVKKSKIKKLKREIKQLRAENDQLWTEVDRQIDLRFAAFAAEVKRLPRIPHHHHSGRPQDLERHLIESHAQSAESLAEDNEAMLLLAHSLLHEEEGREVPFSGVEGCRQGERS